MLLDMLLPIKSTPTGLKVYGVGLRECVRKQIIIIIKVKVSLCLIEHHAMKMYGGVEVQPHHS
jgi:hypothetical protein